MNIDQKLKTDVLVIGGSGAAVTAAIAAKKKGMEVLIVSKGKIGYSGNAIMAGGGFSIDGESAYDICGIKEADRTNTKDLLFDSIVKESYYISDQDLVEQYVEESPEVVNELLQWGERANQKFLFVPPATWISAGISWTKALKQGLKENPEVKAIEDTIIVELLTKEGIVNGAIGIDIYSGKMLLIEAKAVVLGTGGFQPCSLKNTVSDMTGDGIGMAYRAGAKLTDMEFLLAFATALFPNEAKGSIYPFVMEFNMKDVKYDVRDAKGNLISIPEEVIKLSRGKKLSKLISMYYWGQALHDGRGTEKNGVYLDYRDNDKEIIEASLDNFFKRFSTWHKYGYYKGENMESVKNKMLNEGLIEVGLGYEYSMGGIEVDKNMRTNILGLFAAGEVTSGVFGANRVGDGLTEMLCQGNRAGISAADYAKDCEEKSFDYELVDYLLEKINKPFKNKGGQSPVQLHHKIESICDKGFSMIKDEATMKEALKEIIFIKEQEIPSAILNDRSRKYNYEWIEYMQIENLVVCVEAALKAALMRKESRGCHIRSDYPALDHDNYLYKIVMQKIDNEMVITQRKPTITKCPLPSGKKDNIIEYFVDKDLDYKR